MTADVRVECPRCTTRLRLKNRAAVGKKIRCPKCQETFTAEPSPAAEGEDDAFLEALGSLGSDLGEPIEYSTAQIVPLAHRASRAMLTPTQADNAPKRKTSRVRSHETSLPVVLWLAYGLGSGLAAGILWVLADYLLRHELGWFAWVVAACAGLGVRMAAGERNGFAPGFLAVAISLVLIVGSKFAVAYSCTYHIVDNLTVASSSEGAKRLLAIQIALDRQKKGQQVGGRSLDHDWAETTSLDDFPPEIQNEAEERWQDMSPHEREALKNKLEAVGGKPRLLMATVMFPRLFGLFDLVWFFLAAVTAFRIGSGASS